MVSKQSAFQATNGFRVGDTTYVFPLLNSNDVKSGLPPGLLDAFSMTIGEIDPSSSSKIHVHPLVTQVTMVLEGRLMVRLRDETAAGPYIINLAQHQAALVRPGAFLQLVNPTRFPCRVLYVVGPAYTFDADDEEVLYEDAITLDESWEELESINWLSPRLTQADVTPSNRDAALKRIRERAAGG